MSRTHYDTEAEIEARIDFYVEKRDRNLKLAEWIECGAKWLRERAFRAPQDCATAPNILQSAEAAEAEAAKLRSAAEHEDTVTLPKLKAKLAEMQTAPIPGVGEAAAARR